MIVILREKSGTLLQIQHLSPQNIGLFSICLISRIVRLFRLLIILNRRHMSIVAVHRLQLFDSEGVSLDGGRIIIRRNKLKWTIYQFGAVVCILFSKWLVWVRLSI